jgi:sugar O-acyltransferase (sialic acid O-acetyltransferase NeuD family)
MQKKLCIMGTGGFAREILCCFRDITGNTENVCFMTNDESQITSDLMGVPVVREADFDELTHDAIIGVAEPAVREKIVDSLPQKTVYRTLIHPTAVISPWVKIGEGSIITAGCILTCNIQIGSHAQLNLNTTVGHDCVIEDFFTTAPGCQISGNCNFDKRVYLGTAVSVRQGLTITKDTVVGMGGIVVKSIEESGVYAGVPVKRIK